MALTITPNTSAALRNTQERQPNTTAQPPVRTGQLSVNSTRQAEGSSRLGAVQGRVSTEVSSTNESQEAALVGLNSRTGQASSNNQLAAAAAEQTLREAQIEEVAAGVQQVLSDAQALADDISGSENSEEADRLKRREALAERLQNLRPEIDAAADEGSEPITVERLTPDADEEESQNITVERFPSSDELGLTQDLESPEAFNDENRAQSIATLQASADNVEETENNFRNSRAELSQEVQQRGAEFRDENPEAIASRVAEGGEQATQAVREDFSLSPERLTSLIEVETADAEESAQDQEARPANSEESQQAAGRTDITGASTNNEQDNASLTQQVTS